MTEITVRDYSTTDMLRLFPKVRQEDRDEWRAWCGIPMEELGLRGWTVDVPGAVTRAAYAGDTPLCAWGVHPFPPGTRGWVWLVATPEAVPLARELHVRHLKGEFEKLLELFPTGLITASWNHNPVHHKWLRWLGFVPTIGNIPDFTFFLYRPPVEPKEIALCADQ